MVTTTFKLRCGHREIVFTIKMYNYSNKVFFAFALHLERNEKQTARKQNGAFHRTVRGILYLGTANAIKAPA